jgi:hypothetical protein
VTYDLVEWLRLQLDDDERVAREADQGEWLVGVLRGAFYSNGEPSYGGHIEIENGEVWPKPGEIRGTHIASKPAEGNGRVIADMNRGYLRSRHEQNADHIARWDPARVLREIEAKRKLVNHLVAVVADDEGMPYYSDGHSGLAVAKRSLRLLALPYSDRAGFREEWKTVVSGDTPPQVNPA